MRDAIDHGLAFDLKGLWYPPISPLSPDKGSLFRSLDFDLPALADGSHPDAAEHGFSLEIPVLGDLDDGTQAHDVEEGAVAPPKLDDVTSTPPDTGTRSDDPDIWSLDPELGAYKSPPCLRMWEMLGNSARNDLKQPLYLSEASLAVFDAALASQQAGPSSGVLPQSTSLRALCNLALGRPSVFFQWDEVKGAFKQTLPSVPTSGLSLQCSQSLAVQSMEYGATYRNLQGWVEKESSNGALTALKRSVADVLEAIEGKVSSSLAAVQSPLQLQGLLTTPQHLLALLGRLRYAAEDAMGEEQTISAVADVVHAAAEAGSIYSGLLTALLARVCEPWLGTLAADLGLADDPKVQMPEQPDDLTFDEVDVNLSLDNDIANSRAATVLFSPEDRRLVRETRASLAILRRYLPAHTVRPTGSTSETLIRIEPHANQSVDIPNGSNTIPIANDGEPSTWLGSDFTAQLESITAMDTDMPYNAPRNTASDELLAAANAVLSADIRTIETFTVSKPALHLSPFDNLRPLVETQSRHLNTLLLRHLFATCELRKHLNLQHAFHLCGNGDFVTRLSTALFSSETQSAERKRGMVPTSQTMGLRLGVKGDQRWPPASFELRLSCAGILNETYIDGTAADSGAVYGKQEELPGGLSFAIRELPDVDIDRVMDASSIYALDFLRLQYIAPTPLDAILTAGSMQRYDDIFRFLLRLLRVLDVTTRLRTSHRAGREGGFSGALRFGCEAHAFVVGLVSYIRDIGIEAPWQAFRRSLDGVERALAADDAEEVRLPEAGMGLTALQDIHATCLDTIRGRLFLKRKQESLRTSLEATLVAVLKAALAEQTAHGAAQEAFDGAASTFKTAAKAFVGAMRTMAYKAPKAQAPGVVADSEAELASLLLARLNWNGFYDDSG